MRCESDFATPCDSPASHGRRTLDKCQCVGTVIMEAFKHGQADSMQVRHAEQFSSGLLLFTTALYEYAYHLSTSKRSTCSNLPGALLSNFYCLRLCGVVIFYTDPGRRTFSTFPRFCESQSQSHGSVISPSSLDFPVPYTLKPFSFSFLKGLFSLSAIVILGFGACFISAQAGRPSGTVKASKPET